MPIDLHAYAHDVHTRAVQSDKVARELRVKLKAEALDGAERHLSDARDRAFSRQTRSACVQAALIRAETLCSLDDFRNALRIVAECRKLMDEIGA